MARAIRSASTRVPEVRPPRWPMTLGADIVAFTLLHWAVDPERLLPYVPEGLPLCLRPVQGVPHAFFSVFAGRIELHDVAGMRLPVMGFLQLNLRTYVEWEGERVLYIFHSVVWPGPVATAFRMADGFPAETLPFGLDTPTLGDRPGRSIRVGRSPDALEIHLAPAEGPPRCVGCDRPEEVVAFLGNVPKALFPLGEGRLGSMVAPHPPLRPHGGDWLGGHMGWLEAFGVLEPERFASPTCVVLQERVAFPTRV